MTLPSSWKPARDAVVAALTTVRTAPRAIPSGKLFVEGTPAEIVARPESLKPGSSTSKTQGPRAFVIFRDGSPEVPGLWETSTERREVWFVQITCWYWLGNDMLPTVAGEMPKALQRVAEDQERILAALCYPGALATDPSGNDTGLDGGSLRADQYRCVGPDPMPIQRGEQSYRVMRITHLFRTTLTLAAPSASAPSAVSVSGTLSIGQTLTATATSTDPCSIKWQRGTSLTQSSATDIPGSTSTGVTTAAYVVTADDIAFGVRAVAYNDLGSASSSWVTYTVPSFTGTTQKTNETSVLHSPIDTLTNLSGAIANYTASTTARPINTSVAGLAAALFDGTANDLASTGTLNQAITATRYFRVVVYVPRGRVSVNAADTSAYQNEAVLADAGSQLWGAHLKGAGGATYRHQAYHWDTIGKVAGIDGLPQDSCDPVVEVAYYDGTSITAIVAGQMATATAGSVGNGTVAANALHIGATPKCPVIVCETLIATSIPTASQIADFAAYLAGKWGASQIYPLTSASSLRGNGETASGGDYLVQSNAAFTAYRTSAKQIRVWIRDDGTFTAGAGYAAAGIVRDDTKGGVYGSTEVLAAATHNGAGDYDTGWVDIGGSGERDVYVLAGCRSGGFSAKPRAVAFRGGALSTAALGQGSKDILFHCIGSRRLADDNAESFSSMLAALAQFNSQGAIAGIYWGMGRNDFTAGTSAATFQTMAAAALAALRAAYPSIPIVMQSLITCGTGENGVSAAYRTNLGTVVTAAASPLVTYAEGSTIYSVGNVSGDQTHPNTTAIQTQHRDAIVATKLGAVTGRWAIVGDSILAGSSSTENANAVRGLPALLRIWRMTH